MKSLILFLKESLQDIVDNYVIEGIDVQGHTVRLTDQNNRGVDFNLKSNPVYYEHEGMSVVSIFRRTRMKVNKREQDGNPFIYALKGKKGYIFDITKKEIIKYVRRFLSVCNKINKHYDTIIIVPSSSDINTRFMEVIAKQVGCDKTITEFFIKRKKEDVRDNWIDSDALQRVYGEQAESVRTKIINQINKIEGEYFEAKSIQKEYLPFISYIIHNNEDVAEYINGKDVLILDDIMSSGATVSQCVKAVQMSFAVNTITVITLLSKLL